MHTLESTSKLHVTHAVTNTPTHTHTHLLNLVVSAHSSHLKECRSNGQVKHVLVLFSVLQKAPTERESTERSETERYRMLRFT